MAKQPTHSSGHILKPCPQELLWNENPSAYQAPIGSQACQNTSGAYPYARICKYFQLLSTETKAPESQGRSSVISSFVTISGFSGFFNPFPLLPFLWDSSQWDKSCQAFKVMDFGFSLPHLERMKPSMDQFNIRHHHHSAGIRHHHLSAGIRHHHLRAGIRHHHHSAGIIKHSFLLHLGIRCSRRITLEFLPLESSFSSLGEGFFLLLSTFRHFSFPDLSYSHHPKQTAQSYNLYYQLLKLKSYENPREREYMHSITMEWVFRDKHVVKNNSYTTTTMTEDKISSPPRTKNFKLWLKRFTCIITNPGYGDLKIREGRHLREINFCDGQWRLNRISVVRYWVQFGGM